MRSRVGAGSPRCTVARGDALNERTGLAGLAVEVLSGRMTVRQSHGPTEPPRPGPGPVTPVPTPRVAPPEDAEQLAGLYPVAYVGEYEKPGVWAFPQDRSRVVIGGSRGGPDEPPPDISIPERGLSSTHCLLERRASSVRIYDMHSTNGTFVGNTRIESSWDVRIGDTFSPWPLTLFLMDSAMYEHRPMLAEILGSVRPSPDMVLTQVARHGCHVVITGADGCGQEQLAQAIHTMSPRSAHKPIEVPIPPRDSTERNELVKRARKPKTTVFLWVPKHDKPPLDATFVGQLYDASYGVRVVALARNEEEAERSLPKQIFWQSYRISLRPLAQRDGEIEQLLDRMFARGDAAHLRTADLLEENQEALRQYDWPRNLAQLKEVAEAIIALETHKGLRSASRAIGMATSTIRDRLERPGIKLQRVGDTRNDSWSVFRPAAIRPDLTR